MSEQEQEAFEFHMNKLFWKLMKCIGLPVLGIIISGVVFFVTVRTHMADGHPASTRALTQEGDARITELIHVQDGKLIRLETKLDNLTNLVETIEKKIERVNNPTVGFQ